MKMLVLVFATGQRPPLTTVECNDIDTAEALAAGIIERGCWVDNVLWSPFGLSHCEVREQVEDVVNVAQFPIEFADVDQGPPTTSQLLAMDSLDAIPTD